VKFLFSILILIMSLMLAIPANAQENDPWKAGETCIFGMPYIGHAVKRGTKGVVPTILKAIFEPEEIDFEHKELPYNRALEEIKSGEIHMTLAAKDNRKEFSQGKYTLVTYDMTAAYLRKTGFEGIQSFAGKRIAYLYGFDLMNFIPVKFTPQLIYDLSSGFHMLERGHVKYVIDDAALLRSALRDSQLPSAGYEFTHLMTLEIRPIFAKTEAGQKYRKIYDRRMKEMIASGELTEVIRDSGLSEKGIQRILKTY